MRDYSAVDTAISATDPVDIGFERLFGPWQGFTVVEAANALAAYQGPWWVCGGRALEAFTGVRRHHADIDVGFFTSDLDRLRAALADEFDVWSVGSMTLRPLTDEHPTLHEGSEQVWVRDHAWAPWRMDLLATPDDVGRWVNKRDASIVLDLDDATWRDDVGTRYLVPELVLLMKARHARAKDEIDLANTLPRLEQRQRARLHAWLEQVHPGHAWLGRL